MFLIRCRLAGLACVLTAWALTVNAMAETPSVFRELKDALKSRGLVEGVNPKTGEIIGTGICEGGTRTFERARLYALADAVSQLNDTTFSGFRTAVSDNDANHLKESFDLACRGSLIGAEEVVRIQRHMGGVDVVAVAIRWSVQKQQEAMNALMQVGKGVHELESELRACETLVDRTGPVLWRSASGIGTYLGISAIKINGTSSRDLLSAMRLAKIKAQGYLAEHFRCAVTDVSHLRTEVTSRQPDAPLKVLQSFLREGSLRSCGIIGNSKASIVCTDYGVMEVFSGIKTVNNVKYAISVCCLAGAESLR